MILTFKGDIAKRKKFFTPESFAHPAKFSVGMLLWIIGKYTKPGDTILDPMFGSGSTMLAARYGRNVIGVELEQKFVDIAKGNWGKVCSLPKTKFGLGECLIVQGDARNLNGLLADAVVTSPPFGDMNHPTNYLGKQRGESGFEYSDNPSNIGNLSYGKVDAIVSSPPYEATFNEKQHTLSGIAKRDPSMRVEVGGYSGKVDAVISSPPYANQVHSTNQSKEHLASKGIKFSAGSQLFSMEEGYSKGAENIGNFLYGEVDAVISSPPYEGSLQGDVEDKISSGFNSPQAIKMIQGQARGYSKEADNIGNLRKDTYLEAMLKVYQQCYKVLKPNGLMILVTKDFIRKGQRILLSIDTIALCEQAGFAYEDWHQRKLTQQSFWRTLYYQKHPEVEKLDTEDILVFRKLNGEGKVDAVVTSPPYGEAEVDIGIRSNRWGKIKNNPNFKGRKKWEQGGRPSEYSSNPDNIGNLPYDGAKVNDEWIKSRQGRK